MVLVLELVTCPLSDISDLADTDPGLDWSTINDDRQLFFVFLS